MWFGGFVRSLQVLRKRKKIGKQFIVMKRQLKIENEASAKLRHQPSENPSLPKDWEMKKLGEVCEIKNGGTPKTSVSEYWNGKINWITPKDLGKLTQKYVNETPRKITALGLQKSSAKLIPDQSLILSTRAPIGHIAINNVKMATNQGCRGIIPLNELHNEYLYYFLTNSIKLLNNLGTGATFKELSTKALSYVQIPLPPLSEQKRIVAKLDKAFSAIERSRNIAEKNLQNAKELFQSKLQSIFDDGKLKVETGEWKEKTLQEVCDKIFAGGDKPAKCSKFITNELSVPIYSNGEKNKGLYGYTDTPKICTPSITISGRGTIGYSEIRREPFVPIVRLVTLLPNLSIIDINFLHYGIKNLDFSNSGSSIPQLTVPMVKEYLIQLPPLSEQQHIVEILDTLSAETKKLELIYQQKLDSLEELKKSILQKAFNGEL